MRCLAFFALRFTLTSMRVVLDTNVLIDGASDALNAPAKLINAVIEGEVTAIVTGAIEKEYRRKTAQLVTDEAYQERLLDFYAAAEEVTPAMVDVQIDDVEDRKFLKAAVGGKADLVVTADRHLLQVGEIGSIRIVTATEAWAILEEKSGSSSEWETLMNGWGIGR